MKILNLFSGMGCDLIAHSRTNLPPITKVYHSDIDKYARAVDRYLHPDVIHLGDVTKIKGSDLGHIDLLLGGSPCQGFSFSGKQLAFDDPRSKLFFEFVRILKELKAINPNIKFLLENVKMKKEFQEVITDQVSSCFPEYGKGSNLFSNRIEPLVINSSLLSAQSRTRLYWFNWECPMPKDKGIVLKDILENSPIEPTFMSLCDDDGKPIPDLVGHNGKVLMKENINKSTTLMARDYKGFNTWGQTGVRCIEVGHAEEIKGHDILRRVYSPKGKAPTLNTMGGGNREPKVALDKPKIGRWIGRYLVDGKRQDHKMKTAGLTKQRLEVRDDSKSNTLTTVIKDNVVVEGVYWRKLSPLECERLQTVGDNSTLKGVDDEGNEITISNTQRFKMLVNGWTADLIAHILNHINN